MWAQGSECTPEQPCMTYVYLQQISQSSELVWTLKPTQFTARLRHPSQRLLAVASLSDGYMAVWSMMQLRMSTYVSAQGV